MKTKFFTSIILALFVVCNYSAAVEYVDLGLPSGTQWAIANENQTFNYYEAVYIFNTQVPTKEQYEELLEKCTYLADSTNALIFIGPNGKRLFFPKGEYLFYNETGKDNVRYLSCRYYPRVDKYLPNTRMHSDYTTLNNIRLVKPINETKKRTVKNRAINLGLSSGTYWYVMDETPYFTYQDVKQLPYVDSIPLRNEWQELIDNCNWEWIGYGWRVTAKDTKSYCESLFFPATGYGGSNTPHVAAGNHYIAYWANPYNETYSYAFTCSAPNRNNYRRIEYCEPTNLFRVRKVCPSTKYLILRSEVRYVDMGLPSGTKWASKTEYHMRTWDQAMNLFGSRVPSLAQYKELLSNCSIEVVSSGADFLFSADFLDLYWLVVTAKNGNQIMLSSSYLWTRDRQDYPEVGSTAIMITEKGVSYFMDGRGDELGVHLVK